jgi:hypothetical protein
MDCELCEMQVEVNGTVIHHWLREDVLVAVCSRGACW